jgi:hypothetical protein
MSEEVKATVEEKVETQEDLTKRIADCNKELAEVLTKYDLNLGIVLTKRLK